MTYPSIKTLLKIQRQPIKSRREMYSEFLLHILLVTEKAPIFHDIPSPLPFPHLFFFLIESRRKVTLSVKNY